MAMLCKGHKDEGVNCIFNPKADGSQATCKNDRCICCDPVLYSKSESEIELCALLKIFKEKHYHAYNVMVQRLCL